MWKNVFRQSFVILRNIQIKTLANASWNNVLLIMFFLLALKVLEYDSACLQMYTTSKGFRFFFSFKSHKSSNDEDIITIPWCDLQR